MNLQGKKILITAGPTWVSIDSVRVISNIATGRTGILLAQEAAIRGARVTLVMGPCGECRLNKPVRLIRFQYFDELKKILTSRLRNNRYDIIIHSAAVSDFKPEYVSGRKLDSNRGHRLRLMPLFKLVVLIRRMGIGAKLVMFKLETGITDKALIYRAKSAREKNGADLIVANRLNPYRAFIINKENNQISARTKQDLAKKLIKVLFRNPETKR
ncbi:MAG: phosphopantothenoylcysteine decarboxylase [Candidatus Omnitrophota bacterium]